MSLLILGRGEAGRAYRLRTICGVNRIAVDSARIDTRTYTQERRGEGGGGGGDESRAINRKRFENERVHGSGGIG